MPNDDLYNIRDVYTEMYIPSNQEEQKIVNEEYEENVEIQVAGDLDGDGIADRLEEKVFMSMEDRFGEDFRVKCDEIKTQHNLDCDEFIDIFKKWLDKDHVAQHLGDQIDQVEVTDEY